MRKQDLNNTYPQIQHYTKYKKENSDQTKLPAHKQIHATDKLTPTKPKEGKHTLHQKLTGINKHWSLISLNINELNSPMESHRPRE